MPRNRCRRFAILATAAVGAWALMSGPAAAQYPPAADFGIGCEVSAGAVSMTCGVVGALPDEQLTVTAEYNPVFYEETHRADANGEVSLTFDIPAEARGREITVRVVGSESGEVAATSVEATDPGGGDDAPDADDGSAGTPLTEGPDSGLPATGARVLPLVVIGAVLALGGGLLLLRGRRSSALRS